MLEYNVLVVGTVRDVGKTIYKEVWGLNSLFEKTFKNTNWLVIESDSSDNTIENLEHLKKNIHNFNYISIGRLRDRFPKRTDRIAICRNRYLEEIKCNSNYFTIDYVIVIDLDGVNFKLSIEGIQSCFKRLDWDVCAACQTHAYYDIWALRHPVLSPTDCIKEYDDLVGFGVNKFEALNKAIFSKMIDLSNSKKWIKVDSAFGGFAIYKKKMMINSIYSGLENNNEICEHVLFHSSLKEHNARIYINPKLINSGINEHSKYRFFPHNFSIYCKSKILNLRKNVRDLLFKIIRDRFLIKRQTTEMARKSLCFQLKIQRALKKKS